MFQSRNKIMLELFNVPNFKDLLRNRIGTRKKHIEKIKKVSVD